MSWSQGSGGFGKFLFLICLLYLALVLYLAAYGLPTFVTAFLF
ncbi:MAG: hypothetical protein ACE5JS_18520 [Nitrospinota bacterium]